MPKLTASIFSDCCFLPHVYRIDRIVHTHIYCGVAANCYLQFPTRIIHTRIRFFQYCYCYFNKKIVLPADKRIRHISERVYDVLVIYTLYLAFVLKNCSLPRSSHRRHMHADGILIYHGCVIFFPVSNNNCFQQYRSYVKEVMFIIRRPKRFWI